MDESTINLFMGLLFIIVIPMLIVISVQIFEDDDIDKGKELNWDDD
jgi:hypothetical protein